MHRAPSTERAIESACGCGTCEHKRLRAAARVAFAVLVVAGCVAAIVTAAAIAANADISFIRDDLSVIGPAPATIRTASPGARTPAAPPPVRTPRPPAVSAPVSLVGRSVSSTAYCLTGTMANGRRVHHGAVAMNGVPMGSRWRVVSGPYAGRVLVVADRIGHGSDFDIAMPGACSAALDYGRRSIRVERVG